MALLFFYSVANLIHCDYSSIIHTVKLSLKAKNEFIVLKTINLGEINCYIFIYFICYNIFA